MIISNIKFAIDKDTYDSSQGVTYPTNVASNLEGFIQDVFTNNEYRVPVGESTMSRTTTHKLLVKKQGFYDTVGLSYTDNLETYLKEGVYVRITHKKHRITRGWITQSSIAQYIVKYVEDADVQGNYFVFHLIQKDKVKL